MRPFLSRASIARRNFTWPSASPNSKSSAPDPIGPARVVLAAQDEVATLPYSIPMQDLDVKIGGNEFDRLRRWHKQGKLSKSRGIPRQRFPETSSPRKIAALIARVFCRMRVSLRPSSCAASSTPPRTTSICSSAAMPHSHALPDPPPGTSHDTRRLRHRARRRSLHQVFSARIRRRLRPGNASRRNSPRHPGRHPQARRQTRSQNHPLKPQEDLDDL